MLILGSLGFNYTQNRLKIGELIPEQNGLMLIIPLACTFETETGEKEKNGAAMLDFKRENIYVFDRTKPEVFLNRSYDYIVVPGGNTFKLLHYVREFHLDSFIRQQVENGAVYLGFSAGAYLACQNIRPVRKLSFISIQNLCMVKNYVKIPLLSANVSKPLFEVSEQVY